VLSIDSLSLSSGAHSRDPVAGNDEVGSTGATKQHDGQITKNLSTPVCENIPLSLSGKSVI
jgi:hypothetical protein